MIDPMELHELFELRLMSSAGGRNQAYRDALAAAALTVANEAIEAHGGWFDYGQGNGGEHEVALHLRLVVASGVITVDHEFSFDGAPDARFTPWSAIRGMRVIARLPGRNADLQNLWLETKHATNIEFAGVRSAAALTDILTAIRSHLR